MARCGWTRRLLFLAVALLVACGGARAGDVMPPVATIDVASDAGPPSRASERDAGPATPALPAGANGPRTGAEMIGPAGDLFAGTPEVVLLVNSAEIRDHPWATDLRRAITGALVGWNQFMPFDLVHPTKDIEWMLMIGSPWLGSTEDNVFLARHDVPDAQADAKAATLMARLGGHTLNLGITGAKAFVGGVDGADRAFVRPESHVLLIVPPAEAKRLTESVRREPPPLHVRSGELIRVASIGGRVLGARLPPEVQSVRAWIERTGDGAIAHVEAECADAKGAAVALKTLRKTIARESRDTMARAMTNHVLERVVTWQDGAIARMKLELEERDVHLFAELLCPSDRPCR